MAAELTPHQKRRTHRTHHTHRTYRTYRAVIGLGGPLLPVVSFLGRLPTAMCQLGTLLLVAETSGSLGAAGLVGGALAAGQTVGGPFVGRLADRHGQRRVVLAASCLNAVAVAALVAAALGHAPTAPLAALGVVAGLSVPQVGPLARTRLVALARGAGGEERTLAAVFSLEGTLDEVSFVLGPALVGVAAAVAHPAVALVLASALLAVCGSAFALHPTARATAPTSAPTPTPSLSLSPSLWGRAPRGRTRDRRTPRRTVYALGASAALQGGMFGACQAGITALTGDLGVPEQSGLVYGAMGAMSAVVGLAMASVPPSVGLPTRWRLATGAALVLSLPLLTVGSLFALYAVVVVLGCAYAPHLITLSGLTGRAVPAHRLAESMAFMTSAVVGGQALALAVAGPLAEARGPGAAFAVTVGSAAPALLLALLVRPRTSDEAYRTTEPPAAPSAPPAPADAVTSAPPATRGAATPPGSGRSE
ncbi:MFS transporter [Streptomyces sp. NPDC054796]